MELTERQKETCRSLGYNCYLPKRPKDFPLCLLPSAIEMIAEKKQPSTLSELFEYEGESEQIPLGKQVRSEWECIDIKCTNYDGDRCTLGFCEPDILKL